MICLKTNKLQSIAYLDDEDCILVGLMLFLQSMQWALEHEAYVIRTADGHSNCIKRMGRNRVEGATYLANSMFGSFHLMLCRLENNLVLLTVQYTSLLYFTCLD